VMEVEVETQLGIKNSTVILFSFEMWILSLKKFCSH
jgi:hypothetical protein